MDNEFGWADWETRFKNDFMFRRPPPRFEPEPYICDNCDYQTYSKYKLKILYIFDR